MYRIIEMTNINRPNSNTNYGDNLKTLQKYYMARNIESNDINKILDVIAT